MLLVPWGLCSNVPPLCSWQRSCVTHQAMGHPAPLMPWALLNGKNTGKQEGASTASEPLQHTSVPAAGELVCLLTSPQEPVPLFYCLPVDFSGGSSAALSLSWFLTDLAGFYCSLPACWQNNKVWEIYASRLPHRSCEQSLLLRRGSFCWQMLLKCPCVFRPWSIRALELSLGHIHIAVTKLCKVRFVFKSFVGLKLQFIVLAAHTVIMWPTVL